MQERIQKILSAQGICSRRKAEEYILRGLVTVNGKPATLGQKADQGIDRITVDGKVLKERQQMFYYVMHKPIGVITSNIASTASKNVETVRDLLPKNLQGKIYPVGRLDKDSSGLLLFTNDGVLAYRLTHPSFEHEKEYGVATEKPVTDGQLKKLAEGIKISGSKTKSAKIRRTGPSTFFITLTEGKNRQIRRMCQKVGAPLKTLKRIRIKTLTDVKLKVREVRELTKEERQELLRSLKI